MKPIYTLGLVGLLASCLCGQVFVDQAGYRTNAQKRFWTNISADSFSVFVLGSQALVLRGKLNFFSANEPATGMCLYTGDFTQVKTPGRYVIQPDGGSFSFPVTISDSVYQPVFRKALKGYYFQRCGLNLVGTFAGAYYHPACHTLDATYHPSGGYTGFHLTTGGWHDAGDYGKYVVNAGISLGTLLMAYEWFPHLFQTDNLNIPESGNGIPDILDESRYELEWLLKMQDNDGGVFHKVTRENFAPFLMPQNDNAARFIYRKSSTATADFAAVAARAARVFAGFDGAFSSTCQAAAVFAWQYLQTHPAIVPPGGFHNPAGTNTGEYGDSDDRDERLWAAAELFASTGDSAYLQYFQLHQPALGWISEPFSWQNVKGLALLTYLGNPNIPSSDPLQVQIRSSLNAYCQQLLMRMAGNGFGVSLNPGEYRWGSNSTVLNNAIYLIMNYMETVNELYLQAAEEQLHYILGQNAHNMSFVTGVGTASPLHPHHRPSAADAVAAPVPGLLVGGPDQYRSDPALQAAFTSNTPPALCYIDTVASYASNEVAINWNAPLVFVSGVLQTSSTLVGIKKENKEYFPGGMHLEQNFPNPFNGNTTIRFYLDRPQRVILAVYNILGEQVFRRNLGLNLVGWHEINMDWEDAHPTAPASGIYFYRLLANRSSKIGKMVYIR